MSAGRSLCHHSAHSRTYMIVLILWCAFVTTYSFNLYKSQHALKLTSRLYDRLRYHETISIEHNQFHRIDSGSTPLYPTNGRIEFHAFGRYYRLLIRKNLELFSDRFVVEHHRYNESTQKIDRIAHPSHMTQCHYTAEVVSDRSGGATSARLSACRGHGLQGWIHAFGETIVIRPKRLLTNVAWKGAHKISDPHLVYKYQDLDRSDYDTDCGHDHHTQSSQTNTDSNLAHHHDDEQQQHHPLHHDLDIFHHFNKTSPLKRRMQTESTTRYVELAIVNDPGMVAEYGSDYDLLTLKAIQSVATVQHFYLNTDWGSSAGTIQVVLSTVGFIDQFSQSFGGGLQEPDLVCDGNKDTPNLYEKTHTGDYCEVDYESYLNNWHSYRSEAFGTDTYDNAHLLSYFDFLDSVIGYASISGMCSTLNSGGIDQVTYDDEYNGNIIAHEMGHNFAMQHDSTGNFCDGSTYIMAARGSAARRPDEFSSCSISYLDGFFSWNAQGLTCLDNKPLATEYAVCRNGFVELGESCDCGAEDCTLAGDKCCDGSTCGLFAFADCSNNDDCCQDCEITAPGSVCRELSTENSCDIVAEKCDGITAECPPDTFHVEGTKCEQGDSFGYCYNGECKTIAEQCDAKSLYSFDATGEYCGYSPVWQIADGDCQHSVKCLSSLIDLLDMSRTCEPIQEYPENGVPCNKSTATSKAAQCVSNICQFSDTIYTHKWTAYAWDECSISCRTDESMSAGVQYREVLCTRQDGEMVSNSSCDASSKPDTSRVCNNYICDFCAADGICGDHGECDSDRGRCECYSGYDGEFCDVAPSLHFIGVISQSYSDVVSGETIIERADKCGKIALEELYDTATQTRTVPIADVDSLDTLYVGASVGVRWNSSGSVDNLAVGMVAVNADGSVLEDAWPFYVGSTLASDQNRLCDDRAYNETYDGCYEDLSCNDFTFKIRASVAAGNYKLLVRFNNDYSVESDVLHVICNENNCNSTGHGSCTSSDISGVCVCDDGYSGDSCEYSVCNDWEFATCDSGSGSDCGSSIGPGDIKPKCFTSSCDYDYSANQTATSSSSQCGESCSDPHFEGTYCEIPKDYCSELGVAGCSNNDQCELTANGQYCVYRDCHQFTTAEDCEGDINGTNYILYNDSWSIFCEWNNVSNFCNRITCGDGQLPDCANGAVRKPIYDAFSSSPQSICNAWYCDCTTVDDVETSYWTVTDKSVLLQYGINSDLYDINTNHDILTTQFINDDYLPLFLCSQCGLECQNGATFDPDYSASETLIPSQCTNCYTECPIEEEPFRFGVQCNQVFWISSFRIHLDYNDVIRPRVDEFTALMIRDIAYFLGTDIKSISIWQIKPDGSKSIVYFRYLFPVKYDEEHAQQIGGDVMILARDEVTDDTSTAARGFLMRFLDSSYKFKYCIPYNEECDPDKQINFNLILLICFLCSFAVQFAALGIYWFLTREKRQQKYEATLAEQKRVLKEMEDANINATRVGMRDVSRSRAKKIAYDKSIKAEMDGEKAAKTAVIDEAMSLNSDATTGWTQHVVSDTGDDAFARYNHTEMQPYVGGAEDPEIEEAEELPQGWQLLYSEDGQPYYHNTASGQTQWEKPQ